MRAHSYNLLKMMLHAGDFVKAWRPSDNSVTTVFALYIDCLSTPKCLFCAPCNGLGFYSEECSAGTAVLAACYPRVISFMVVKTLIILAYSFTIFQCKHFNLTSVSVRLWFSGS